MGIRGSLDSDRWKTNLNRLGVTGNRADRLLHDLVSQTLVELTDLYKVRYAALQQRPVSNVGRGDADVFDLISDWMEQRQYV